MLHSCSNKDEISKVISLKICYFCLNHIWKLKDMFITKTAITLYCEWRDLIHDSYILALLIRNLSGPYKGKDFGALFSIFIVYFTRIKTEEAVITT